MQTQVSRLLCRRDLRCAAAAAVEAPFLALKAVSGDKIRVRFAPSPTGNLHVGGARTALFNWLYAKRMGGKFVLRIEDTDAARSTRESEEAMLADLKWLGLNWDEGPGVGGSTGPYRQSERKDIYKKYVDILVEQGIAYPCFCTDEELEVMKKDAEEKKLPPVYRGPWARATKEQVDAALASGKPYCYRFRVPSNEIVKIDDRVRGDVSWNTDTLGDFVILRSNGLPVYNFCVAIDDALMQITHVIRAEEHLPNTLRQVLIYKALGFPQPTFGHVSLILAPDRSKLSKRHGATSVGEFRQQGYLAAAMVNYLSLLGWNDGSEKEIYTAEDLCEAFSLERITKSAAVFDKVKLSWMNGQHLRALPVAEIASMVGALWTEKGILKSASSPFVDAAASLMSDSLELVIDSIDELKNLLSYPIEETLASEGGKRIVEDGLKEIVEAVLASYDNGELATAVQSGHDSFKKWINTLGKAQGRKGKRLFMPIRVVFTGRMQGPDVGEQLAALSTISKGEIILDDTYVQLSDRMEFLRTWLASA